MERFAIGGSYCLDSCCFFKLGERIVQLLSQMTWQPKQSRARKWWHSKKKKKKKKQNKLSPLIQQQSNWCNIKQIAFKSRKIMIIIWKVQYFSFSWDCKLFSAYFTYVYFPSCKCTFTDTKIHNLVHKYFILWWLYFTLT